MASRKASSQASRQAGRQAVVLVQQTHSAASLGSERDLPGGDSQPASFCLCLHPHPRGLASAQCFGDAWTDAFAATSKSSDLPFPARVVHAPAWRTGGHHSPVSCSLVRGSSGMGWTVQKRTCRCRMGNGLHGCLLAAHRRSAHRRRRETKRLGSVAQGEAKAGNWRREEEGGRRECRSVAASQRCRVACFTVGLGDWGAGKAPPCSTAQWLMVDSWPESVNSSPRNLQHADVKCLYL